MVSVKIFEKEYPIAYTVAAQSKIADRFGGIEKIEQAFGAGDIAALMENMAFCASVMMGAYEDREAVRSEAVGNIYARSITLTPEQVSAAILPSEVKACLLYTSPSPRDLSTSRMPSSA